MEMVRSPWPFLDPPYDEPSYRSTALRAPKRPLLLLPHHLTERHGPVLGQGRVAPGDSDLTRQGGGEPIGQRIVVAGRVVGSDGRPVAGQLVEIWQANAAGRYAHSVDRHPAPLDPNFTGVGRCTTGADGSYRFVTILPGAYPWANHDKAWRPAHIHFSLFGRAFTERLVTQMYFPGDPLQAHDPILQAVREPAARQRLIASFDIGLTEGEWALGYRWDIAIGGRLGTPMEGWWS